MSILIRGFNMPSKDDVVLLYVHGDGDVWYAERGVIPTKANATAEELPPHGRLADIDEILKHQYNSGMWKNAEEGYNQFVVDVEDIDLTDFVYIEAEGEKP